MAAFRSARLRRSGVVVAALAVLAAGCGDDSGGPSAPSAAAGDPALCAQLEAETPGPEFVDTVPAEFRPVAESLVAFSDESLDSFDGSGIVEMLSGEDAAREFSGFADLVEATCSESEAAAGVRAFATMAELGSASADSAYCDLLADSLENDSDEIPAELIDAAPAAHREAFELIQRVADEGGSDVLAALGPAFGGLGLFLETQCGQEDAFLEFYFIGALASAFGSEGDGGGGRSDVDPATQPGEADAAAANEAVPAGVDIEFTTTAVALQEDGDYVVRAVVPEGWEPSEPFLDVTFEPTEGAFGVFTEMSFDAGCDGLCQTTDWEARLTGPEGFVTRARDNDDLTRDELLADGVVLVSEGLGGGTDGRVIRWNDGAERYFSCEFSLEAEMAELVEAFVAACTSAVPGWFPAA